MSSTTGLFMLIVNGWAAFIRSSGLFHVGFGFSTAAKFDALGVDPDKPAFGCVPFFDSDLHH